MTRGMWTTLAVCGTLWIAGILIPPLAPIGTVAFFIMLTVPVALWYRRKAAHGPAHKPSPTSGPAAPAASPSGKVVCPRCGSDQIQAFKKGFGWGKAVLGDLLLGPVGLVGGALGMNNVELVCLNCGKRWRPGKRR